MSKYWAQFVSHAGHLFRIDTRVYLEDVAECREDDFPVGAVVAKNPGSARPSDSASTELHPITLSGDNLIPNVRSIVRKAYVAAGLSVPSRGFIQVLNLFYLCDKKFAAASRTIAGLTNPPIDPAEGLTFPWVMYLYGEFHRNKAPHIGRFKNLSAGKHFYLDQRLQTIVEGVPDQTAFPRHTQGMDHDEVVAYLASLLGEQ